MQSRSDQNASIDCAAFEINPNTTNITYSYSLFEFLDVSIPIFGFMHVLKFSFIFCFSF